MMTSGLTLGSLFDGIGGFPLAGVMCGMNRIARFVENEQED